MKITRHKKVKRTLNFYVNNFKFREPYQVLVEGTFAYNALKNKIQIKEQISNYFQGEIKLLTTKCLILELEQLAEINKKLEGALKILKQFPIHQCGHEKKILAAKCVKDMLKDNNPSRYIVATQDRSLQEVIRQTPATPLLYLHVQAPTLEPPSEVDQQFAKDIQNRTMFSIEQEETLKKMKQAAGIAEEPPKKAKKKKKNKGGPNPLSCLKKKKKAPQQPQQPTKSKVEDGKVKKPATKKVRIPAHVREELTKQILRERGMSTNS